MENRNGKDREPTGHQSSSRVDQLPRDQKLAKVQSSGVLAQKESANHQRRSQRTNEMTVRSGNEPAANAGLIQLTFKSAAKNDKKGQSNDRIGAKGRAKKVSEHLSDNGEGADDSPGGVTNNDKRKNDSSLNAFATSGGRQRTGTASKK